jgi:lysylphosphatidylglycerol synthetase-like protein (DUF2156 family)
MNDTTNNTSGSVLSWAFPYGIIFGLILVFETVLLYLVNLSYEKWVAVISYAILFGMSYFVISKRKEFQQNYITLGEGFKVGFIALFIATIISTIYIYIHMQYVDTHYLNAIIEKQMTELQDKGVSQAQIDVSMEWVYKIMTPTITTLIGFFSSGISSMVFALISAAILKNEKVIK